MSSFPYVDTSDVFNTADYRILNEGLTRDTADKLYLSLGGGLINGNLNINGDLSSSYLETKNTSNSIITNSTNGSLYGLHLHSVLTASNGIYSGSSIAFNNSDTDNTPLAGICLDKIASGNGNLIFSTRNGSTCDERMRITSTGLGIGMTAPAYKLDVLGDINCSGSLRIAGSAVNLSAISGVTAGTATASKALVLDSNKAAYGLSSLEFTNTTGTDCIILRQSPASCVARFYNSPSLALIGTASAHPFYIQTAGSLRFYISETGNMGNLTTPAYTMDIRGCVRGEGVLACTSTSTTAAAAGEVWSYDAGLSAGTSRRHFCYGRSRADANDSHYYFNSVYYGDGNLRNHTVWGAIGRTQGISMTRQGNVMIAGEGGYSVYEATEATLHVRGYKNAYVDSGWGYHSNGGYSIGGGTVPLSLKITNSAHFQGTLYVTSDIRLKKNIKGLDDEEVMKVLELNAIEYDWKADTIGNQKNFGFSAQETLKVIPRLVELVSNEDMEEVKDEEGNVIIPDKCQLVMPLQNFIPYLQGVCKNQEKRIKRLESILQKIIDEYDIDVL